MLSFPRPHPGLLGFSREPSERLKSHHRLYQRPSCPLHPCPRWAIPSRIPPPATSATHSSSSRWWQWLRPDITWARPLELTQLEVSLVGVKGQQVRSGLWGSGSRELRMLVAEAKEEGWGRGKGPSFPLQISPTVESLSLDTAWTS